MDGSINFNRSWSDYKNGFGFINSEFWIGNQKLSTLTNQRKYQLQIDVENAAGSFFHVTYDSFRITDEFSYFSLVNVGQYRGTVCKFNCNLKKRLSVKIKTFQFIYHTSTFALPVLVNFCKQ